MPASEAENDEYALLSLDDLPPDPEMPPWEQEWQVIYPPVNVPINDLDDDEQIGAANSEQLRTAIEPSIQAESEAQGLLSEQGGAEKTTPPLILPDWDEVAMTDEDEPDILHFSIPTVPRLSRVRPEQPLSEEPVSLPLVASVLSDDDATPQEPSISNQPMI